jgi:hypothetical protein
MWESTYAMDEREAGGREGGGYQLTSQDSHRGVMCVWEFGAIAHEHVAWTAYLRSARDEAAKRAYLTTQYTGLI